jgi:hypothetical protein
MNLGDTITGFINSPRVVNTFKNPIIIALIITGVVLLILFTVLAPQVELIDKSAGSMIYFASTVSIYTVIAILSILYLHNRVVKNEYERKYVSTEADDIVSAVIQGREMSEMRHLRDT